MKRLLAICLIGIVLISGLPTNISYAASNGALQEFLNLLSNTNQENRNAASAVLGIYLNDPQGVTNLQNEIGSFLNADHLNKINQMGYSLEDVKAGIGTLNNWSMEERNLLVGYISSGNSSGISNLVNTAGNSNTQPSIPGGIGGGGSTTEPDEDTSKEEELLDVNFKDIEGHKNKDSILYLAQRGIIEGKSKDKYDPQGELTRAEFMALITRVLVIKPANNKPLNFKDVKVGSWYYEYIKAAFDEKIIEGTSPTSFSPNNKVTREQMVAIIMRILNNKGITFTLESTGKDVLTYKDSNKISSWAATDMFYGVKYGIIEGRTNTTLNPKDFATRGEAAEIVKKLYDLIKK